MDPADEISLELLPLLRMYKDGRVERLRGTETVPPSIDPKTGVSSKDVEIAPELGVSARLYLPKLDLAAPNQKFPFLVYYHGGGFIIESPFSPLYHPYLNSLVADSNVIAVSVHYRRVPEHPLPAAYDDAWTALKWTASHASGGPEPWLRDHGNFDRVFIAGDSAGGNITHNVAMRAGTEELGNGVKIHGAVLIQPYFWGAELIGDEMNSADKDLPGRVWMLSSPSTTGLDDPLINPMAAAAPSLSSLGCERVLTFVAGKDTLRDRDRLYHQTLVSSGWTGEAEIFETEGEDHVFQLFDPGCEKAAVMMKRFVDYLKG
ncbi:hypothetical protein ACLOJK_013655 [Asimina triloba]